MDRSNDTERALTAALRAVAEDDAPLRASAAVEARLLAEVRAIGRARRRRRLAMLAAAAVLLAAASVPVYRIATGRATAVTTPTDTERSGAGSRAEVTTAFLPLAYSSVPVTDGQLVRLEVPRTALASFGLADMDAIDSRTPETVLADVLVGEDGLARAVRFVRPAGAVADQEQTR